MKENKRIRDAFWKSPELKREVFRKASMTSRPLAQTTGRMGVVFTEMEETGGGTGMCKTKHSINSASMIPVPGI